MEASFLKVEWFEYYMNSQIKTCKIDHYTSTVVTDYWLAFLSLTYMQKNSESELTFQVWFVVALYLISQETFSIDV